MFSIIVEYPVVLCTSTHTRTSWTSTLCWCTNSNRARRNSSRTLGPQRNKTNQQRILARDVAPIPLLFYSTALLTLNFFWENARCDFVFALAPSHFLCSGAAAAAPLLMTQEKKTGSLWCAFNPIHLPREIHHLHLEALFGALAHI